MIMMMDPPKTKHNRRRRFQSTSVAAVPPPSLTTNDNNNNSAVTTTTTTIDEDDTEEEPVDADEENATTTTNNNPAAAADDEEPNVLPESTAYWSKPNYAWSSSFHYVPPRLTSSRCAQALHDLFHNTYYDTTIHDPTIPNFLLNVVVESSSHPSGIHALFAQPYVYSGGGLGNSMNVHSRIVWRRVDKVRIVSHMHRFVSSRNVRRTMSPPKISHPSPPGN
jgi:hypothetical protein